MKTINGMRKIIAVLLFILLAGVSQAAELKEWKIDVALSDDSSAQWTVTLNYNVTQQQNEYFVFGRASDIAVTGDDQPESCNVEYAIGTTIRCNNISAKKIIYSFRIPNSATATPIAGTRNINRFSYIFAVTRVAERFSFTIKLPLGTALVERDALQGTGLLRFEPGWGREGSDGRSIFVEWVSENPRVGDTYSSYVIFENVSANVEENFNFLFIPLIIGFVAVLAALFVFMRRRPVKDILPVLTDSERSVMEILIREGKEVDQRKIVKETDFSKTKVSRIIYDLSNRGIVEKIPKGRTNLIKMKKITERKKSEIQEQKAKK